MFVYFIHLKIIEKLIKSRDQIPEIPATFESSFRI